MDCGAKRGKQKGKRVTRKKVDCEEGAGEGVVKVEGAREWPDNLP